MQIAVLSMFRNAESYVQRYANQINFMRGFASEHTFRSVIVEGDSVDGTYAALKALFDGAVSKFDHNGPVFGSTGEPERFRQMARVKQAVFDRITPQDDAVIYVEGDLIWEAGTMLKLLGHLQKPGVDIVAPITMYQGRLYDSWGLRGPDGVNFGYYAPFHSSLVDDPVNGLYPLSAAGSCLVMKGEVARKAKFTPPELEIVGFTQDAVKKGFGLWLDPNLRIQHP